MLDEEIIQLYQKRDTRAIMETERIYKNYLYKISFNILENHEDCMECLNDTYLKAWNSIPPTIPKSLVAFLGKVTRNIALNRYEYNNAQKRRNKNIDLIFEELEGIIGKEDPFINLEGNALGESINEFLASLKKRDRIIFVKRYWYGESIEEIVSETDFSEGKIKSILFRTRNKMKLFLSKDYFK